MTRNRACGVCVNLKAQMRQAREKRDPSAEVDTRVLYRRHMREAHGENIPLTY